MGLGVGVGVGVGLGFFLGFFEVVDVMIWEFEMLVVVVVGFLIIIVLGCVLEG